MNWSSIRDKLKLNSKKGWATLIAILVLGAVDTLNKAYGLGIPPIPEWVFVGLGAFGIFVDPKRQ